MKSSLIQVGAAAGAFGAIFGLFVMLGWDIPPYASMARAENLEEKVDNTQQLLLQNSLFVWQMTRDKAADDLKRNPEDQRAKDEKRKAEKMIDRIECQLGIGIDCNR